MQKTRLEGGGPHPPHPQPGQDCCGEVCREEMNELKDCLCSFNQKPTGFSSNYLFRIFLLFISDIFTIYFEYFYYLFGIFFYGLVVFRGNLNLFAP